jgi:type II secretory ATPase GspE/PulE/Tfp pilus assembly ATPase PilB-like protein
MAQRLVRTVCNNCKELYKPSAELLKIMKTEGENVQFTRGRGCQICKGTGYKGRTGIFELMTVNDFIRELIMSKSSTIAIREAAIDSGMRTLRQDGINKVIEGETTVEEVFRATAQDEEA